MFDNGCFEGALMKLLDSAKPKGRPAPAAEKIRPSRHFSRQSNASQGVTISNGSGQHVHGNSYIINISAPLEPDQLKAVLQAVLCADPQVAEKEDAIPIKGK
jgi:hypothetical protein